MVSSPSTATRPFTDIEPTPSVASNEPTTVTSGRCATRRRVTSGLNPWPDDAIVRSDDRSQVCSPASSAPSRGRADASPTIVSVSTRSRSTVPHTSSGSKRGDSRSTTVPPPLSAPTALNRPVLCVRGATGITTPDCLPASPR